MMQYDNTKRGSLFKNDRKEKETHPDLKGSININWSRVLAVWLVKGYQQGRQNVEPVFYTQRRASRQARSQISAQASRA
jgi:hypothetical protein